MFHNVGVCPAGKAIRDRPIGNEAHAVAECSNQGICERNTGVCKCFPPFTGESCNEMMCPTKINGVECSGHGQCLNMAQIAASDAVDVSTIYGSTALARSTIAWDYNIMKGCLCNSSWAVGFGNNEYQITEYGLPDCSLSKLL